MRRAQISTESVQKDLGLRVRELRHLAGLTQEEGAVQLGMLTPNYARIEQGRMNVTIDTVVRLANMLGVSVADLFIKPKVKTVPKGRPKKSV